MRDGEFQRARQLAADPVQGIEAGATASVFAGHLPYYYLRIGEYVQRLRLELHRILQRLKQRDVLSNIVVLETDPLADADAAVAGTFDDDPNACGARVPQ